MTAELVAAYAVALTLLIGSFFTLVGAIGLLKFNDSMTRLHAPTKVSTVGVGMLLLASIIHSFAFGEGAVHEALIMALLFVTAPISAIFIAKVNIHQRDCNMPPELPGDELWATLDVPDADRETEETERA